MTNYGEKTRQEAEQILQKMQQQMQEMQTLLQDPNLQKSYQDMQSKIQKKEGVDTIEHSIKEDYALAVHVDIHYEVERHETVNANDGSERSVLTDSWLSLDASRDFSGELQKVYEVNRGEPERYHYHVYNMVGDTSVFQPRYRYKTQIIPDGGSFQCKGEQWTSDEGSVSINPLAEDTRSDEVYRLSLNAGITMQSKGCVAYPSPHFGTSVLITEDDLDELFAKGMWEKQIAGVYSTDLDAQMMDRSGWRMVPLDTLIVYDPQHGGKFRRAEMTVRMMLAPRIEGPHYTAVPKQTIDLIENLITLRAQPIPGWKLGEIQPIGGWEQASSFVEKADSSPPPKPTITLRPKSPGKVSLEMEWVSPKGKQGKTDPFDVTVVQLEFKPERDCKGFDDIEVTPAAASACIGRQKTVLLEALPAGTELETELKAGDVGAFTLVPEAFITFPPDPIPVILTGTNKKNSRLTAKVHISKDEVQTAAQIYVDVMKVRTVQVLPIFLDADPLNIAPPGPDVNAMFQVAADSLFQSCIELDPLPLVTLKPQEVPNYPASDTVIYNSNDWELLQNYAKKKFKKKRDLDAFFVPRIATETTDANGINTLDPTPLGFQIDHTLFVSLASFPIYPHVLGHEIGHYIFGEMYTNLEGDAHTEYLEMLMSRLHSGATECEIIQEEWRHVAE